MTDITLDEKALAETQVEFDNVPPGLVEAIIAAWVCRTSPSQVAPANPAQVTDALPAHVDRAIVVIQEHFDLRRSVLLAAIGAGGQAVAVKPLIWEEDHGIAGMGPYRLFKAETPLGRFVYGTDAEGSAYYHTASSGVMMVGDEATAQRLAEAAWQKAALAEVGKFVDPVAISQPHPADERVVEAVELAEEAEKTAVFWGAEANKAMLQGDHDEAKRCLARAKRHSILAVRLRAKEGRNNG